MNTLDMINQILKDYQHAQSVLIALEKQATKDKILEQNRLLKEERK